MSSLLTPGLIDYDDQAISHHIENVERRIRLMSRAMQSAVHFEESRSVQDNPDAFSHVAGFIQLFYEYVDSQMDELTKLRGALERDVFWVSLAGLREGEDFRSNKESKR